MTQNMPQEPKISRIYNILSEYRIVHTFEVSGQDEKECKMRATEEMEEFINHLELEQEQ